MICNPPPPITPQAEAEAPDCRNRTRNRGPDRAAAAPATMDLILDVELPVSISFGKTELPMKDVLKLTTGSIVELNRGVNDPVEVTGEPLPDRARGGGGGRRQLRSADPAHREPARPDAERAMNLLVGALAILSAIVLTGTAVSLFALRRAHGLLRELEIRPDSPEAAAESHDTAELRRALEGLAAQVHDLQRTPPSASLDPAQPRPGLNLGKRTQALRMHRLGESPEQIAGTLQVPRQEVDLLLKVHRIVLSKV